MTPSSVTPTSGAIVATISGSAANRARAASGSSAGTAIASHSHSSRQRRGSPAATPPSAEATRSTMVRARSSGNGRRGGGAARSSAARIDASVLGPIPRTSRRRPPRAASRSSSAVRMPSAAPISIARRAPKPWSRPRAASSGETVRRSSSSSAIVPVFDELAQPGVDAGPDPAKLAGPSGPHERRDVHGRRRHELGPPAECARRVGTSARELEQRAVLAQLRRDRRVVERAHPRDGRWATGPNGCGFRGRRSRPCGRPSDGAPGAAAWTLCRSAASRSGACCSSGCAATGDACPFRFASINARSSAR